MSIPISQCVPPPYLGNFRDGSFVGTYRGLSLWPCSKMAPGIVLYTSFLRHRLPPWLRVFVCGTVKVVMSEVKGVPWRRQWVWWMVKAATIEHLLCVSRTRDQSVQYRHSVVSDSLRPHGLQHARLPCPSPTPRVYSNSWPLSRWCHPTISSSVIPFSSCPQSFPAPGSFPMSQGLFASGGQSSGVSASISVLPMNTQDWSPLGWTGWISLQSKGLSRVLSNTTVQKHQFFGTQPSSQSNSHIHAWLLEKP